MHYSLVLFNAVILLLAYLLGKELCLPNKFNPTIVWAMYLFFLLVTFTIKQVTMMFVRSPGNRHHGVLILVFCLLVTIVGLVFGFDQRAFEWWLTPIVVWPINFWLSAIAAIILTALEIWLFKVLDQIEI